MAPAQEAYPSHVVGLSAASPSPLPLPRAGMNFVGGVPQAPTYSDAYLIDAGVCLLAPSSGKVRRIMGGKIIAAERIRRQGPFPKLIWRSFPACIIFPTPPPLLQVCNGPAAGTPNLDSVTCACAAGYRGAGPPAVPASQPATHITRILHSGTFCEFCSGPQCPSSSAASAAAKPSTAGDVAAGVIGGLLAAGAVAFVVYVRFFGGGPAVVSAVSCMTGAVAGRQPSGSSALLGSSGKVPFNAISSESSYQ